MARAFRFRITSEGVTELQAQLRALGPAGEEAFRKIANASPALRDAFDDAKNKAGAAGEAFRRSQRDITDFGGGVQIAKHQMGSLFAQVQDIYVSLASGQSPFTVMTQQVPQAATAVGGMSNLLRIMAAQITPLRVGLAATGATLAVLGLQAAALAGEQRGLDVAIKGAGKSAELSAGQFRGLVEQMRDQGVAAKDARKAIEDLIRTPGLSGARAVQLAELVPDFAAGTGTEAAKAAEALGKAFADGAEGVKKLDEQLNFLSAAEARNIRDMAEHGRTAEALDVAVDALGRRFNGLASEALGPAERALNKLGREYTSLVQGILGSETAISIVKELADAMESANRGWRAILNAPVEHKIVTLNAQLEQAKENLAKFEAAGPPTLLGVPVGEEAYNKSLQERRRIVTDLQQQVDGLIAQQRALASATASATAATGVNTKALKDSIPEIERQQKAADEYSQKARDALAVAQARGVEQAKIRARQEAEEYISKNKITDATIRANIVREKENELVGKYLAQEAHKGIEKAAREAEQAEKDRARGLEQSAAALAQYQAAYEQKTLAVEDGTRKLNDENEILTLLARGYDENSTAVTTLKAAKEAANVAAQQAKILSGLEAGALKEEAEAAQAAAKGQDDVAKSRLATAATLHAQADDLRTRFDAQAAAAAENARLKASYDANKEVARHFEQVLNEANRNIADVFYQAFTGKITGIGDFLKNIFFRQLSQGLAEAIAPITAQVLGIFVPGQRQYALRQATALSASGGGGGLSSLISGASNASSLYSLASNPAGFFSLAGNPLATLGSNVSGFLGGATLTSGAAVGASLAPATAEAVAAAGFGGSLASGGAAASLTPLAATGYGAAIAAAAIILTSVLGGFLDRKPTPAAGALLDINTGQITDVKTKALDDAYVTKAVQDLYPTVQGVIDRYGLSLAAGSRIGAGTSINKESGEQYFDLKLIGPDSAEGIAKFFHQIDFNAKDAASSAEAMSRLTLAIIQESDAAATAEGANVKAAAATLKLSDAASLIDKVLASAERFDKGLGPLADQLVAINTAAREFAGGALTKIKDYLDIGSRIGGEAGKAAVQVSRDYLDTLLGLKEAAPVLSETAAAFKQGLLAIKDLTPALEAAHYSADEIAARQAIATETVTLNTRNSFLRGLSGRNNPAQGQVDQLTAQYGADLRDAAALFGPGATSGAAAVNTSFAASVDTFLKSLQPDALAGVLSEAAVRADSASQYIAQAAAALVNLQQASQMAAQAVTTTTNVVDLAAAREARRQQILAGPDVITNTANFADARALIERGLGIFGSGIGITGLSGAASESYDALKGLLGQLPTAASSSTITKAQLLAALGEDTSARPSRDYYAELASKVANADSSLFKPTTDNGAGALAAFPHSRAEYLGALRRLTGARRLSELTDISGLSEQQIIDAIGAQRDEMTQARLSGAGFLGGTIATTRGVRNVDQAFAAGRSGTDFLSTATSLRDAEAEGRRQRDRQLAMMQRQLGTGEETVRLLGQLIEVIRTQPQALATLLNTVRANTTSLPYGETPRGLKWGA